MNTPVVVSGTSALSSHQNGGMIGLMLVEDNPGDVRLVEEMLRDAWVNLHFQSTGTVAEATAQLSKGSVDVVLVDLGLPDSQGLDTCRRIREAAGQTTVVIVLTGNQDDEVGLAAIREGADEYLIKGEISGSVLVRSVRYAVERKRAEEALRNSEAKFRGFFENAPEYCYMVAPDGRILDVNRTALAALGYEKTELVGQSVMAVYAPDSQHVAEQILKEWQRTGSVRGHELEIMSKHGVQRSVLLDVASVHNEQGEILHSISIQTDITRQKELESQFRQAQKMEAVGKLAGGVAHDFNNVLGVIIGYAEMALLRVNPGHFPHEEFQAIHKAGLRAADIVRQLLAFARKQTIEPKVIDLNSTVEGMLKMLRRLMGEDIDIAWLPGSGLWQIEIDPAQIDQILANLSINARDSIAGVGKVSMETENVVFDEIYCNAHVDFLPGEYVMLAVSDDGCGMDKDVLDHLFEPFFTTKGVGEGTGLGLATVYGIVKQNEGFINVYSEPRKGSTFKIYFPRCTGTAASEKVEAPAEPQWGKGETVLLVEDDVAMLILGKGMLERLGYVVLAASTPNEAVNLAEEHTGKIHLLITDVVMPQMSGRDLAERLVSLDPNMRRLFMSGYTANVIAHRGVLDEGVYFIQKPFSMMDLATKVREVLEEQ
jgi:two-component system, cell cycle sensor histidine kinase and response regulator CckA